jgi:Protein of unknown function (DUF3467)
LSDEPHVEINVEVPPEQEIGVYANFLSVWHSPHDFTLDFGVTLQAQLREGSTDERTVVLPTRIVSRVKIPLTVAQDMLKALSIQIAKFEESAGLIQKPGDDRPWYPQDERPQSPPPAG